MKKQLKDIIEDNIQNLPLSFQFMEFKYSKGNKNKENKISKLIKSSFYQSDAVEVGIVFHKDITRLI